ncbi:hypothetical protein ASD38_21115 [Caulobacter sp. Root487D2Y]|uniref:hypothetical protein n=1 Tax=Caulobacter sp. Root487D2Y TaxID=1736547 RepID=UPI0006FEB3A6|nr:hypothetical protein [Caulobacter sp. Root487D2Y]KQY34663.1 hypothetical protein ASD38_21115 [Caulobacter sp. Root487D2Y]
MARTLGRRSSWAIAGLVSLTGAGGAVAGTYYQPLIYGAPPIVYTYGAAGENARMPMSLTDTAPTAVEGEVSKDGVIAQHLLRVDQARVLTSLVQGRFREIPAGTALARVEVAGSANLVVWCDLRANTKWNSRGAFECLTDTKGAGAFDQGWAGVSDYYFAAAGFNVVSSPRTLTSKGTWREAKPEEHPTLLLGYKWCDGDGAAKPARFARALQASGDKRWFVPGACASGATAPLGGGSFDLPPLKVATSAGAAPGALHYKVEGRLPPAPLLQPVLSGLADLSAPPAPKIDRAVAPPAAELSLKPLVPAGAPPVVVAGDIAKGQPFFTVGVRHGVTGVLKQEVRGKGWFFDKALPVGQPVYGVPMAGASATGLVWCAPRQDDKPKGKSPTRWAAACLPQNATQANWVEAQTAMMSVNLSWFYGSRTTNALDVERGPIDLPPMTLSYVFAGWSEQGSLMLEVRLDWGEGPQLLRALRVAPGADGVVTVKTMDGVIAVKRSGDAAQAQALKPLLAQADVVY